MTNLIRAEIRRLTSRRLARLFAALFVVVLLLIQGIAGAKSNDDVEGARRKAEAAAVRDARFSQAMCERAKTTGEVPAEYECGTPEISPDDYYVDPRYVGREWVPGLATGVAVAMAIVGFIVGASFVGAEWHAGTMQALLFWEPRRGRVLLAKGIALVVVLWAFTLVMQLLGWSTAMLNANLRGTTQGVTSGLQQAAFLTMGRGMVVIAFTSLLAFAIAGLTRVTGAALGAAFGYFVILENLIRGLRPGWTRWVITPNVAAVMTKRFEVEPAHPRRVLDGELTRMYTLTSTRGAITLGVYLLAFLGVFYVWFSRRDVT